MEKEKEEKVIFQFTKMDGDGELSIDGDGQEVGVGLYRMLHHCGDSMYEVFETAMAMYKGRKEDGGTEGQLD